jgi:hypothetical protein
MVNYREPSPMLFYVLQKVLLGLPELSIWLPYQAIYLSLCPV